MKKLPSDFQTQTSSNPPYSPGQILAADVMVRDSQRILLVRDTRTSFTLATIIQDEKTPSSREALIQCVLYAFIHPLPTYICR